MVKSSSERPNYRSLSCFYSPDLALILVVVQRSGPVLCNITTLQKIKQLQIVGVSNFLIN